MVVALQMGRNRLFTQRKHSGPRYDDQIWGPRLVGHRQSCPHSIVQQKQKKEFQISTTANLKHFIYTPNPKKTEQRHQK